MGCVMQKLTSRKQLGIVRLYLAGLSYDEIAAREGVGKGTVANIVSDLKGGRLPDVHEPTEQIEMLREVALDVHRLKITPGQAVIGIATLARLQEVGVAPDDVANWAAMCRELAGQKVDVEAFVNAALALDRERRRTGLTAQELEQKANSLQETVARLEPMAKELQDCQGRLKEVQGTERALADKIAKLEERRKALSQDILLKEKREADLSGRIEQLESRAHAADARLAVARRDERTLASLGLSLEGLTGIVQRFAGVAERHGIGREAFQSRLLHELEQLDKGIGIETLVQAKQKQLTGARQIVAKLKESRKALEASNEELRQQQAALHAAIAEEQHHLRQEMRAAAQIVKDAAAEARQQLSDETSKAVGEVESLKSRSLELGREIGRFEAVLETNDFLRSLLAMARGDGDVKAEQARIASLTMARGLSTWIAGHRTEVASAPLLGMRIKSVIEELEQWKA